MSLRSPDLEGIATPRRGWVMGASVLAASAAITGAGFVTAPSVTASAPVAVVQNVALTADPNAWITDLLAMLGLGDTSVGEAMTWFGLDGDGSVTVADLAGQLLGPFGDTDLGLLLPAGSVDSILASMGLGGDLDAILASANSLTSLLGFDLTGITLADAEQWFGFPDAATQTALTALGLGPTATLANILDSDALAAALLPALPVGTDLGDLSIPDLLGVPGTATLFDILGVSSTDSVTEGLLGMLGLDDTTTLLGLVGDWIGIPDLTSATLLSDVLADLFGGVLTT